MIIYYARLRGKIRLDETKMQKKRRFQREAVSKQWQLLFFKKKYSWSKMRAYISLQVKPVGIYIAKNYFLINGKSLTSISWSE